MTPPVAVSEPTAVEPGVAPASAPKKQVDSAPPKIQLPSPPTFDDPYKAREYLKGRLALAFRVFGKYGFDEGVAGHITLRDPVDPETFWVNPFGVPFSHITASSLVHVSETGHILNNEGRNPPALLNLAAYMIHAAIHRARPDVMAAAHAHSIHGRAFCALGRALEPYTQDDCAFHGDHAVYDQFNGVVLAEEEGRNIAACLGQKKAALLVNHGLLTVGRTVEEAVWWFVALENCCHVQLMAEAAAGARGEKPVRIGEEEAVWTGRTVGNSRFGWFSGCPLMAVVEREAKGEHLE